VPYHAVFRCIAGCHGEHPLDTAIYNCPVCGDLLEVSHDIDALKDRSAAAWMRLFDERYKRTDWPFGSSVWGNSRVSSPASRGGCRTVMVVSHRAPVYPSTIA